MPFTPQVRGAFYASRVNLEDQTALVAALVGDVYELSPRGGLNGEDQRWIFDIWLEVTAGVGTVRAWIVTSDDGATWQAVAVSDTLNGVGVLSQQVEPLYLLRYVGICTFIGGAPTYDIEASILSNMVQTVDAAPAFTIDTSALSVPSDPAGSEQAGLATVAIGATSVDVTLPSPYTAASAYAISLNPASNVVCWYTQKTAGSFRINISAPLAAPLEVSWIVSGT